LSESETHQDCGTVRVKVMGFARAQPILRTPRAVETMSRSELIIQLLKIVLGAALGAYFVWWSLEVLQRLPP
jgi:hypothetical protein